MLKTKGELFNIWIRMTSPVLRWTSLKVMCFYQWCDGKNMKNSFQKTKNLNLNLITLLTNSLYETWGIEEHVPWHHNIISKTQNVGSAAVQIIQYLLKMNGIFFYCGDLLITRGWRHNNPSLLKQQTILVWTPFWNK